MKIANLCTALKEAIKDEIQGKTFYSELSGIMPDDKSKELIRKMSQDEGYHEVNLRMQLKKWCN